MIEDRLTTQQAADLIGLALSRIQQLCRAYIATGEGLTCERIGEGRRAIYLVSRRAAEAYRDSQHKRGWIKGRKRSTSA